MTALDTNVLIYACDKSDPRRQQIALELIATVTDGVLLWQVACEFVAASRKLNDRGFTPIDAWNRLTEFLDVFRLVLPSADIFPRAQDLHVCTAPGFLDTRLRYAAWRSSYCSRASLGVRYASFSRRQHGL